MPSQLRFTSKGATGGVVSLSLARADNRKSAFCVESTLSSYPIRYASTPVGTAIKQCRDCPVPATISTRSAGLAVDSITISPVFTGVA